MIAIRLFLLAALMVIGVMAAAVVYVGAQIFKLFRERDMGRPLALVLGALVLAAPARAQATQEININDVAFVATPDLRTFAETTKISRVDVRLEGVEVTFDKRDVWPMNITPGWDGPLSYSLGMCLMVDRWTCSAPIETWRGRDVIGGPIQDDTVTCPQGYRGQVACNWFYDSRWGALQGRQPYVGEAIGVFVVAGDPRNNYNPVRERSNIVIVNMPARMTAAAFTFSENVPTPTPPPSPTPPPTPTPGPTPTPVPGPTPSPLPSVDLGPILAQLSTLTGQVAALQAKVDAANADAEAFRSEVRGVWKTYVLPIVTTIGAVVSGWALHK